MIKDCFIGIGEIKVTNYPSRLAVHGLGSCVGLFLYDRLTKVAGAAHVFLPDQQGSDAEFMGAEKMLVTLLKSMKDRGADLNRLRAMMVGGASMFTRDNSLIGNRNSHIVHQFLRKHAIYLAYTDTGGKHSRNAVFDSEINELIVRKF